jgi:hypothetical protein
MPHISIPPKLNTSFHRPKSVRVQTATILIYLRIFLTVSIFAGLLKKFSGHLLRFVFICDLRSIFISHKCSVKQTLDTLK